MMRYIPILLIFLLLPIYATSQEWVKSDNGCKYLTHHVDASKIRWDGKCLDGMIHGEGTLMLYKNDTLYYEFKGIIHYGNIKKGVISFAQGEKYVGEFKDGKHHGQGTLIYANGNKYVGEFKDQKYYGQGTYTWANGDKYVGEFKDGNRHGQGTYIFANGEKYVGESKGDKYHGQGTLTWAGQWTGQKYVGEFKDNKRHGQGILIHVNGEKYVGEFKDHKYYGQGTYIFANGNKYVGEFKDGKRHGQGFYLNQYNSVIKSKTGIWADDRFKKKIKQKKVKKYLDKTYPGYPKTEKEMEKYLAEKRLPKYPQPQFPPDLALEIVFKEPSGNKFLDAEEEGEIQLKIINNGKGEAYGLKTSIALQDIISGLLFEDVYDEMTIDKIIPGSFTTITKKISATENISNRQVGFKIDVKEFNGFDLYPSGKLVIETKALLPPNLQLVDIGIDDLTNYNGRIDPNEVVEAKAIIQNKGQGTAKGVNVSVVYGNNVYNAGEAKTSFSLGDMDANQTQEIDFSFFANRNASNDLPITISIKEQRGKFDKTVQADLALNKNIKKSKEVFIAGIDEAVIAITDKGSLSIDVEKNIPKTKMKNKNGIAVVIGNRDYENNVPQVDFAVRDAEYIKEYLIQTLGYRQGNIFYYTNSTLADMKVAFNKLKDAVKPNKSDVFVYYSGHGAPDPNSKQGYFVPTDADPNYIRETGFAVDELYTILNQTRAINKTVVIDACFSGNSGGGMILKNISPVFIDVEDSFLNSRNSAVFTSATGEQVSSWYTDKSHSLFTYYFLKGLQGEADLDSDGTLILSEIKNYIDDKVPYMARRMNGNKQNPQLMTDDDSRVLVRY